MFWTRKAQNFIISFVILIFMIARHNYFVELREAQSAIKEIIRELDKKPITVSVLNTRVDTARDLVLKLFGTTKGMMKAAKFAEMAIVYGNRYRSEEDDLDRYLTYAEKLFYEGEYKKSLEVAKRTSNKQLKACHKEIAKGHFQHLSLFSHFFSSPKHHILPSFS